MNDYEFNKIFQKVINCFPQFGERKSSILFEKMMHLNSLEFENVCDKIIITQKYTPSIFDFIEQANIEKRKRGNTQDQFVNGSCGKCTDGLAFARAEKCSGDFVFKCPCTTGSKREENYPVWDLFYARTYTLVK